MTAFKSALILMEVSCAVVIKSFREMARSLALVVQVTNLRDSVIIPIRCAQCATLPFVFWFCLTLSYAVFHYCYQYRSHLNVFVIVVCVHNSVARPGMLTDKDECAVSSPCDGGKCVNIIANKTSGQGFRCECSPGFRIFLDLVCSGEPL